MTSADNHAGSLEHLFLQWIQSAYTAEKDIVRRLPRLIAGCGIGPLRQVLLINLDRAHGQVVRLREIFAIIGEEEADGRADAIAAELGNGERAVENIADDATRETAIIAIARSIAANEIVCYRALVTWSKELGREDCTALLETSLSEEHSADEMLRKAAEERQNRSA